MTRRMGPIAFAIGLAVTACGGGSLTATTTAGAIGATTVAPAPSTDQTPATLAGDTTTGLSGTTTATAGDDLTAFISRIAEASDDVRSIVMSATFAIDGIAEVGSLEFGMNMAADYESRLLSMRMDLASLLAAAPEGEIPPEMADLFSDIEMRSIGDVAYLKFPFFNSFLGVETDWMSMSAEDASMATDGFGASAPTDPTEMLKSFAGADAVVIEIDTESLNGVDTTHYRIVIDMEQLAAVADFDDQEALEQFGGLPTGEVPIDLWIDTDGRVRRMQLMYSGEGLELAPDQSFESMIITMDVSGYNVDVLVEAPPADQVTDVSDISGDIFGDLTG